MISKNDGPTNEHGPQKDNNSFHWEVLSCGQLFRVTVSIDLIDSVPPEESAEPATSTREDTPREEGCEVETETLGLYQNIDLPMIGEVAKKRFLLERGDILEKIRRTGFPHYGMTLGIMEYLPKEWDDSFRRDVAYSFVPELLNRGIGVGAWATEARPKKKEDGETKWIVLVDKNNDSSSSQGGGTISSERGVKRIRQLGDQRS